MHAQSLRGLVALVAGALVLSFAPACTDAGGGNEGPVINHIQVSGEQPAGQPVAVVAQVTDSDGLESVAVYYQAPHAGAWNSVLLALDPTSASTYAGEIPGAAIVAPSVSYYLEAKDRQGTTTRLPATAPTAWFTITVAGEAGDTDGPVISHVPIVNGRALGSTVTASATVTDVSGVGSVVCRYRAQGATEWIPLTMTTQGNDKYQANFPVDVIVPEAVEYYLEAVDTSPNQNHSTLPLDAPATFYTFTVSHGDETAPVITHTPIADGQPEGRPIAVVARIEDATGVGRAEVFYRTGTTGTFTTLTMTQSGTSGQWSAIIPASAATSAGVDYYIEAEDTAPLANAARVPDTAPGTPYHFTTAPETCVVPPLASESFEAGIFPGWWRTTSAGTGCEWTVDDGYAHDGAYSAYHAGYGDGCNDLLILPCLDLTGLQTEGLVIDFWQKQSSVSGDDIHTLEWAETSATGSYAVIGSPLPYEASSSSFGYRKVAIPPGAPMLGKSKVYFAFRYVGDYVTGYDYAWYLDEIRVRQPGPAIELSHITASPNPVTAGASNVNVNVTLRNSGDGPSPALTGTLTTTDSGITIGNGSSTFAGVAAGGETTSATPFTVSVAAGHADGNAPLKLAVTDGTHNYNIEFNLYVGVRAQAHIVLYTTGATWESDTELYLGYGADPANPDWIGTQIPYVASDPDTSGTFTYDIDLTAHVAHLPPTMATPWFLKALTTYSSGALDIKEFSISYGATSFTALGLPWHRTYSNGVGYLMVPEPPRFVVDAVATTPTTLQPGSSGVQLQITVRNLGSATQGVLSGTLALAAPTTTTDITGLTPTTAVQFAGGPVGTNATATGASTWTFNVTTAHNDGSPLHFNLALSDATSGLSWNVPVSVDVPWPGVSVVDWAGATATLDSDSVPDPGEGAFGLVLVIKNSGSLVTAGPVTASFVVDGSSTAPASVASDTMHFGNSPLAAGARITSTDFVSLTLNSGAQTHQKVVLRGTFTDGTNTWQRLITIPVYAHVGSDPQDASSASPDLRFAQYHCDNTTLTVRLIGWSSLTGPASGAVSVIIAHPTSGAVLRLRDYNGTLSAYTLNASGTTWDPATAPPDFTVTPTEGATTYLEFHVPLADIATFIGTKEARLGAQADGYGTYVYDYLPDAWSALAPASLPVVTWP